MKTFTKIIRLSLLFLISGWSIASSFAQCEETELTSSDGAGQDNFGAALALDRSNIAVGATGDDNDAGSVYILKKMGGAWVEKSKLLASDRQDGDLFGAAVALQKNRVVVAAPYDDDLGSASGSVYVYTADGANGFAEAKLHAADGVADEQFGTAVATFGDRIAIGARNDQAAGFAAGAAYVFRLAGGTWVQEAKLISADIHDFDIFGVSVAMGGRLIAVGALGAQTNGVRVGTVYVFGLENGNWVQQAKLVASDPNDLDFFGGSVAMTHDGTRIIAGAAGDDEKGGAAYIFRRDGNTWVQEAKLLGDPAGSFGTSVAINSPYCAVGAIDYVRSGAGYLFLFDGTNWNLVNRFEPSDGTFADSYGQSVAVDQRTLAAGAPLHRNESGPGAVYVYDPNCAATGK
jgi:hypothetical protein